MGMTPGELRALVAPLVDASAESVAEVVVVIVTEEGEVGLSSTCTCAAETLAALGAGITRVAVGLHAAEGGPAPRS